MLFINWGESVGADVGNCEDKPTPAAFGIRVSTLVLMALLLVFLPVF